MPEGKLRKLTDRLRSLDNAVIAYSGGVDSTLLVRAAQLAGIRFLAVTGRSATVPEHDIRNARETAVKLRIPYRIIDTDELQDPNFVKNPPDRCYYCKNNLFSHLRKIAGEEGYDHILDGSNSDDLGDYRPGLEANRRHGVRSPLIEAGLTKEDVREVSRFLGLPTWNVPSSPCLSSRFPYGERINPKGLDMVAQAEAFIRSLGFLVVRVRTRGETAMVEVGQDELDRLFSTAVRESVLRELRRIGYKTVLFDAEGYCSGKLNRALHN